MKRFSAREIQTLLDAGYLLRREMGMVLPNGETAPNAAELSWKFRNTLTAASECIAAAIVDDWRPT